MLTYNIFNDLFKVQEIVDDFFHEIPVKRSRFQFPNVKIYEGNDDILITAVVPGIKSEDLEINLVDNNLVIEGEKKNFNEKSDVIRKEREYSTFKRSIKLPYSVDVERINAELKDGILNVTLYKSEAARPKKIEIK